MVGQQGGRLDGPLVLDDAFTIESQHAGIVQSFDGQQIGRVVIELGGGRRVAGQSINHRVGLEFQLGVGDTVELGQPIATVFCQNQAQFERAAHGLLESIAISQKPVIAPDLFEAI
jgi:thymidine phosphorylase